MAKLTPKQKRFCKEYLIDLNASAAAVRAGYSQKTANRIGNQNLSKLDIQNYIHELMGERSEALDIEANDVVRRLWEIATFNIKDCFDANGKLKAVNRLPPFVSVTTNSKDGETTVRVTMADRIKALEILGKHLGMFTDKLEVIDNKPKVVLYWPNNGKDQSKPRPSEKKRLETS